MLTALLLMCAFREVAAESVDVTQPPAYEEFLVIPLRVHVLSATDLKEVHCNLQDEDILRVIGKVNRIWNVAGIHFGLESIVHEAAAEQDRFRLLRDVAGVAELGSFTMLVPTETRDFEGLHVYFVHKLPVNGVHFGGTVAFVQETASLRPVPGGIDEPLPRVTAHELGHALSLAHRQDTTNLLASGTNGTLLNEDEVKQARNAAALISGARTTQALRAEALDADRKQSAAHAKLLQKWLADIPGQRAEDARQHVLGQ